MVFPHQGVKNLKTFTFFLFNYKCQIPIFLAGEAQPKPATNMEIKTPHTNQEGSQAAPTTVLPMVIPPTAIIPKVVMEDMVTTHTKG
jgi:hypothetical protein